MRKKVIILAVLVLILATGATVLGLYKAGKLKIGADEATSSQFTVSEPNMIVVKLPKELANTIKNKPEDKSLDTTAKNELKELTDKELKKQRTTRSVKTIDQGNTRADFVDYIIAYTDEKGDFILPDLKRLKNKPITRMETTIPSTNKLTFKYDGFSDAEQTTLQQIIDQYYPRVVDLWGPPLFNNTITISKGRGGDCAGLACYYPDLNLIGLSERAWDTPKIVIHEIGHAWRDDLIFIFYRDLANSHDLGNMLEEGMTDFMAALLTRNYIDSDDYLYDSWNQPFFTKAIANYLLQYPYTLGRTLVGKIYIENNAVLKAIHNYIYQKQESGPEIFKEVILSFLPQIEGLPSEKWYSQQYILHLSDETGRFFVPDLFNVGFVETLSEEDLVIQNNKEVDVVVKDKNSKIIVQGRCKTKGWHGTITYIDPFSDKGCLVELGLKEKVKNKEYGFKAWEDQSTWTEEGVIEIRLKDPETNLESKFYELLATTHDKSSGGVNKIRFLPPFGYFILPPVVASGKLIITNLRDGNSKRFDVDSGTNKTKYPLSDSKQKNSSFEFKYYCPQFTEEKNAISLGVKNILFASGARGNGRLNIPDIEPVRYFVPKINNSQWEIKTNQPIVARVSVVDKNNNEVKLIAEKMYIDSSVRVDWTDGISANDYQLKIEGVNKWCDEARKVDSLDELSPPQNPDSIIYPTDLPNNNFCSISGHVKDNQGNPLSAKDIFLLIRNYDQTSFVSHGKINPDGKYFGGQRVSDPFNKLEIIPSVYDESKLKVQQYSYLINCKTTKKVNQDIIVKNIATASTTTTTIPQKSSCDLLSDKFQAAWAKRDPGQQCGANYDPVMDFNKDKIIDIKDASILIDLAVKKDQNECKKYLEDATNPCAITSSTTTTAASRAVTTKPPAPTKLTTTTTKPKTTTTTTKPLTTTKITITRPRTMTTTKPPKPKICNTFLARLFRACR